MAKRVASGWKSSEFAGTFGATGGVLYIAYEMIGKGQYWPAALIVVAGVVLPGLYTSNRLTLKAKALMSADPAANVDPIDLFAEAIITRTAGALAPQLAKMIAAQGVDPLLAQVKAENIAQAASGLVVDLIDVFTDVKAAKRAASLVAAAAKVK